MTHIQTELPSFPINLLSCTPSSPSQLIATLFSQLLRLKKKLVLSLTLDKKSVRKSCQLYFRNISRNQPLLTTSPANKLFLTTITSCLNCNGGLQSVPVLPPLPSASVSWIMSLHLEPFSVSPALTQ